MEGTPQTTLRRNMPHPLCYTQGCQWEVITKAELHFVVSLCVGDVQCPKGAMTEVQRGLRERNMSLYNVRNYLLGFR